MIEQQRKIQQIDERQRAQAAEDRPGTWLDFHPTASLQPFSANGTYFYAGLPRATVTPRRLRMWALVKSTNNAANYYTIDVQNSAGTSIAFVTTGGIGAITPDVWTLLEDTGMSSATLTAATDKILQVVVTKTGTPGALSITPMFYVL